MRKTIVTLSPAFRYVPAPRHAIALCEHAIIVWLALRDCCRRDGTIIAKASWDRRCAK